MIEKEIREEVIHWDADGISSGVLFKKPHGKKTNLSPRHIFTPLIGGGVAVIECKFVYVLE